MISEEDAQRVSEKSDGIPLWYLGLHFMAIVLGGWATWQLYPHWSFVLILLVHAVILGFLFAPLHECAHGTAFKTRWLNEVALWWVAIVYIMPPNYFRYFHLGHHRYTQIVGRDPSLVLPEPANFRQYLWYNAGLWFWWRNIAWICKHAVGSISSVSQHYVPAKKRHILVLEARILVGVYAAVAITAYSYDVGLVLFLCWLLPRILGEPVQRMMRVAEHVGCAENADSFKNTRTTISHPLIHAIAWQMPYHAEHHLFPNAPFYRLSKLHKLIGDQLIVEPRGYIMGQVDIIKNLLNRPTNQSRAGTHGPML